MARGSELRLRAFVGVLTLTAGAVLVAVLLQTELAWLSDRPVTYGVLSLMVLVGELRTVHVARGAGYDEITVSTTFSMALALVGPLALVLVVQGLAVAVEDLRQGKSPLKMLFNVSQYVLVLFSSTAVFCALTGEPVLTGSHLDVPGDLPAAMAAGVTFFAVNCLLVGVVTALARREAVRQQVVAAFRLQAVISGVLLGLAPVVATIAATTLWLLPLLLSPIVAVHQSALMAARREREALHDTLTGLPNRSFFRLRTVQAMEEASRLGEQVAVMLVDLDHFKDINDTLGHHVGDALLVQVAERLQTALRTEDVVARFGGDEFAVLATGLTSTDEAVLVARRLLEALATPIISDGVRLDVPASIGIALHPEHGSDVDLLVQRADIALYAAKVERGTWAVYETSADGHSPERLLLATEVRDALREGQLFCAYQPKTDAATGRVVGLEALVRWLHPTRGVVMPDEFLPVVENTGLAGPLTELVLGQALQAVAGWRAAGHDLSVAVNLSARSLGDLGLVPLVAAALTEHGVPASALVLEVTETGIMTDPTRAVQVLAMLRQLGVQLAVDDFGTGYSSLAYLRRLDVDELKIDKSFVMDLASQAEDAMIVRSTVELGHNLGLRVVAEGVEDQAATDMLRGWGCDVLQGYLISRPLAEGDVLGFLGAPAVTSVPRAAPPVLPDVPELSREQALLLAEASSLDEVLSVAVALVTSSPHRSEA